MTSGIDTGAETNPVDLRFGRFVDLDLDDDVIGIRALRRIAADGVRRPQLGILLGHLTDTAWSDRLGRMIGDARVLREAVPGDAVEVTTEGGPAEGALVSLPLSV